MSQLEFDGILRKYLAGKCTPAEEQMVLEWYETFIKQSQVSISPAEKEILEQKLWSKIRKGSDDFAVPAKVRWMSKPWLRLAAAACVSALLLSGGYIYFNQKRQSRPVTIHPVNVPDKYLVADNKDHVSRLVTLSDGSVIELQPQSSLYYPANFSGSARNVYLEGSAFFKVTHDSSMHFQVHTAEGLVTEVLGTSFYITHDEAEGKVEVSVITGKVSVYEEKDKKPGKTVIDSRIVLTPNQKVSYKPLNNLFVTSLVEDPRPISRPGGEPVASFIFDDTPLTDVIKSLETTYGVSIQLENKGLGTCHFTGDITKQTLYDKLNIICRSLQSSYEVKGTLIYLRGKGCD